MYHVFVSLAPEVVGDDHDVNRAGVVSHAEVVAGVWAPVAVIVAASIDFFWEAIAVFYIVGGDHWEKENKVNKWWSGGTPL